MAVIPKIGRKKKYLSVLYAVKSGITVFVNKEYKMNYKSLKELADFRLWIAVFVAVCFLFIHDGEEKHD